LLDSRGKILSQASFDNLQPDTSMVRRGDGGYQISDSPTPGRPND
ncbi:MAG: hypothetical protein GX558_09205, partial [Clostridiales bacterium]|nr:hypothetical protein [Clostridiales bacterium]